MRIRMLVPSPVRVHADRRDYLVKAITPRWETTRIVAQDEPGRDWALSQDLQSNLSDSWDTGFEVLGPQPCRIAAGLVAAGLAETVP